MPIGDTKILLSIVELGGYPNFASLYQQVGYEVVSVISVRKAMSEIKCRPPAVIVAEFNFQSDFRDRTSSLESLLSVVQRLPDTKVIIFYETERISNLDKLLAVFPVYATLPYPIDAGKLEEALQQVALVEQEND